MGCSASRSRENENKQANKHIEIALEGAQIEQQRVTKLLLLGSGSSGKSTLFKQLRRIHGHEFTTNELSDTLSIIRHSCVMAILKLLKQSDILYYKDERQFSQCYVDMETNGVRENIEIILSYDCKEWNELWNEKDYNLDSLSYSIAIIWKLDGIQNTYNQRGSHFSFPDNMDYFLNKVIDIMTYGYQPNDDDALRIRVKTTGIIKEEFNVQDHIIHIFDVGGQRSERKKWIHHFDSVTAVIFVTALNHFNARLFEDEKKNAMHESIELFDEICNSKWFRRTEIILFLNKQDLFRQKIENLEKLDCCFSSEVGWEDEFIWEGTNYEPDLYNTQDEKTQHLEMCCHEAIEFILKAFLRRNANPMKKIYSHITQATDRNNIEKVFWDVQNILIRTNLRKGGLVV